MLDQLKNNKVVSEYIETVCKPSLNSAIGSMLQESARSTNSKVDKKEASTLIEDLASTTYHAFNLTFSTIEEAETFAQIIIDQNLNMQLVAELSQKEGQKYLTDERIAKVLGLTI
jgi:hypothetical protein